MNEITFVTPYWNGREMMQIHLQSIRQFYPSAPILISKKGGEREEMEAHRAAFDVQYWMEECNYDDALLRLLERCATSFVCILDHDTVLLSSLDPYVAGLKECRYDVVGVEERIREPSGIKWWRFAEGFRGWLRLAPGNMDSNVILFNWRDFVARWGLRGVAARRHNAAKDQEFIHGIAQRLTQHKYWLPYHTRRYGLGNVLMDGDIPVVWHQWFGSYRVRLSTTEHAGAIPGIAERVAFVQRGEQAFLQDYPRLDLSNLTPAWGPDRDVIGDSNAIAKCRPSLLERTQQRVSRWSGYGLRGLAERASRKLERWWRLR
jgi:hypothetical protein